MSEQDALQAKDSEKMELKLEVSGSTLFIIPCCKTKKHGGQTLCSFYDPLGESVCSTTYGSITSARAELLNTVRKNSKYMSGEEYSINEDIRDGPDFGLHGLSGKYLSAICRYKGKLYKAVTNFSEIIKANLTTANKPKILILSALYGPLHPLSMIQDYNLKMSDSQAYQTWTKYFALFLKDYAQKNKISSIHLYLGSTTHYFKVAERAIIPLLEGKLINQAIQFEVKNGDSCHTPTNHGLLVSAHLGIVSNPKFTRAIIANVL